MIMSCTLKPPSALHYPLLRNVDTFPLLIHGLSPSLFVYARPYLLLGK